MYMQRYTDTQNSHTDMQIYTDMHMDTKTRIETQIHLSKQNTSRQYMHISM